MAVHQNGYTRSEARSNIPTVAPSGQEHALLLLRLCQIPLLLFLLFFLSMALVLWLMKVVAFTADSRLSAECLLR